MKQRMRNAGSGWKMAARAMVLVALACCAASAYGQSCELGSDLDDAVRNAITTAAQRYFDMAAKADTASLKQNAIPSLAADFSGVENTIKDNQKQMAGAQATAKQVFELQAEGTAPLPRAEFYCGVFGKNGQTPGSAEFFLDNLPPGTYAVVVLDAASGQSHLSFSEVLQQAGTDWKLGGLYVKPAQIAGHDSDWFLARARDSKSKGQALNAWLFFQQTRSMLSPLPFMSTLASDKIMEEMQGAQPADMPAHGKTADLVAGTATYKLTSAFPQAVGDDLDLVVKYQAADVSNTNAAYQSNVAVMKALVTAHPELRSAFAAVVARAVDPAGHDYGTLMAMGEIK
jgi:hypothetical protein